MAFKSYSQHFEWVIKIFHIKTLASQPTEKCRNCTHGHIIHEIAEHCKFEEKTPNPFTFVVRCFHIMEMIAVFVWKVGKIFKFISKGMNWGEKNLIKKKLNFKSHINFFFVICSPLNDSDDSFSKEKQWKRTRRINLRQMIENVCFYLRLKERCRNLNVNNGRMRHNMQKSVQTSFQIRFHELINERSSAENGASIDDKRDQRVRNVNQFHECARVFFPRIHTEPRQHMPIHHQWLHFYHFHLLLRLFLLMNINFTKYLWITNGDSII